ncbi:hypothetical protein ACFFLZ_14205 [Photobacterium aphoticum]|uniref:Uncharacterized protein n=1 Tax=Photobacterium aphoticum TaxID=754436 RepID=A0A0J1JFH5_9GAMM|nr:hypothetical protein [Photobacterium aphoticum]KLV00467.1 hypothetical protein ABT58_12465 [Photobacterium aphoticum]PSU59815.1 hypothetical protein C9I90_02295 [Photobacterium aphoticum]GHA42099.1 hypothetical protein GCM10007086_14610 [Photobacterium aphoticum]
MSCATSAYELTSPATHAVTEKAMRNAAGAPSVSLDKRFESCEEDCSQVLKIGGYRHGFNPDAELLTVSRYKNRVFALVKQANDESSIRNDYFFVTGRNIHVRSKSSLCESAQATGFSYNGELLCLNEDTLDIYTADSKRQITLPMASDFGQINNNLAGTVAITFVNADKQQLHYANLYNLDRQDNAAWHVLPTRLHNRSDRRDVIATYPVNRNAGVVAMYEYINPFNKGLTLYSFAGQQPRRHVLTNSEAGNFGFDPEVFVYGAQYAVTAEDPTASRDESLKTYLVDPELLQGEDQYTNDNESQSQLDFMAGYGLTYNMWDASQSVGDDVETDYEIDPSFLHSVYFQARYSDTQVSLKYLTNQAKEKGPDGTSEAVDMLTGLVDFNGFFEGADTLRLKIDWTKTQGLATYKAERESLCLEAGCEVSKAFSTEYLNVETLVMSEGGMYLGLSYSTYAMPSAVGFTRNQDSDHVIGSTFDEDYEQARLMFVMGSDEAAYGARYETDYDRIFLRPNLGFGVVKHSMSAEAEERARNGETGGIAGKTGFVVSGGVDIGYIYQRRWREASGLGFSLQTGLRARLEYTMDNFLTDASDDEIYFKYNRFDVMWGPYVQFNAIF